MSVNSHRQVQFPRGQHSKTSFHSGGSAAKETSYLAKDEKVSPESSGFAACALSYYCDEENESDREDFLYYHEQVRHEKYQRDPSQLRYLQNSLYETECSPERRLLDHHRPRTEYFMEEYPPNYKPRKSSVYSSNSSSHRSYSKMDSCQFNTPVNTRSSIRYPNKKRSLYLSRERSPDYDYKQRRKRSPRSPSRQHRSPDQRRHRERTPTPSTANWFSRRHRSPDHQRSHNRRSDKQRTPRPSYLRPRDSHRNSSSSNHRRTGDSHHRSRYYPSHRSSRRGHCSLESSSCSSNDDSSSYSSSDSESSSLLSSDDSLYKSTDSNSSPERKGHK